jgi:undecaprenyl-diphosphatase
MLEWLIQYDSALFQLINSSWNNALFDFLMPLFRNKTFWIPLYIVIVAVLTYKYKLKVLPILLLFLLTVLLADQFSSELIKKSVQRLRPCNDSLMQENLRLLIECGKGFSFTSSHATNHFALAFLFNAVLGPVLLPNRKNGRIFFAAACFLWAFFIAYAQVYVGLHYPLDVAAGALLGIVLAALTYKLYKLLTNNILKK